MPTPKTTTSEPKNLNVKSDSVIGSTYAQIVGVVITDDDMTLEFVYKNPRPEIKEAHAVARVTLPRKAAEQLSQAILDTIAIHEKGKQKKNEF